MTNKPAVTVKFDAEPDTPSREQRPPQGQRLDQLYGAIRIVDVEPTWTPRGRFEESIALLIDGGTPNLCVYDYENEVWQFAELSPTRIP